MHEVDIKMATLTWFEGILHMWLHLSSWRNWRESRSFSWKLNFGYCWYFQRFHYNQNDSKVQKEKAQGQSYFWQQQSSLQHHDWRTLINCVKQYTSSTFKAAMFKTFTWEYFLSFSSFNLLSICLMICIWKSLTIQYFCITLRNTYSD